MNFKIMRVIKPHLTLAQTAVFVVFLRLAMTFDPVFWFCIWTVKAWKFFRIAVFFETSCEITCAAVGDCRPSCFLLELELLVRHKLRRLSRSLRNQIRSRRENRSFCLFVASVDIITEVSGMGHQT